MKLFNNRPIRVKLKIVILSTSVLTVVLIFAGFFIYEYDTSRKIHANDLSTKAEIIAENSNAALTFSDSADAARVLNSLVSQPHVVAAAIYNSRGILFSTYIRKGNENHIFPERPEYSDNWNFEEDALVVYKPILLNGIKIGTIYLNSDLDRHRERFWSYLKVAFLVLLGSLIVAYIISALFARSISAPIVKLAQTAIEVSEKEDYSLRADKVTNDETGLLVSSFNRMLDRIMDKDKSIRETNKTLQNAEKRYRTTLDNMMEGCQIIGYDWQYLYLNEVAISHSRKKREELLSHTMMNVYPGIENTDLFVKLKDSMEQRVPFKMENEFHYPDGTKKWFNLNIEPVPEGLFVLSVDITEEKLLQEELKKYHENLEELVKERTQQLEATNSELESFSYTVSHDLRAPVRHISGFLDILKKNIDNSLDEKNKRYFNLIKESANEMGTLIDDLLAFSRTAKADVIKKEVNLNEIVNEIIDKIVQDNESKIYKWKIENLPEVKGDPALLRVVMVNLISNAVKFSSNSKMPEVTIGSIKSENDKTIFVKDNGVGFDMNYYEKLFGVFQRLHNVEDFPGTGIGLATIKKIITKHGGKVWANSKEGQGATFFFSLPDNGA